MSARRTFEEDVADALLVDCSHCGRKAGHKCIAADSTERNYPHIARLRLGDAYRELRSQQTRTF